MTTHHHDHGAPREFYDGLAGRALPPHTVRGIRYRNLVVAGRIPSDPSRVLEIGPGEGWLSSLLTRRGHRVIALDIARSWVARIPPDQVAGRIAGMMTDLPFAERTFDVVVAAEVVEHIPDLPGALAEAARVLAPGGHLVVTVPYRETLTYVACPECGERYEQNGHCHTFDIPKLEGALRAAGLEPRTRFVGPTRFSREILRRAPIAPLLPFLMALDRMSYRSQRVTDTWMLMTGRRW
jgi:SAM-dependent methyltransferase